jgi:outer membrane protein OmpA-like peptidoglycan-associated protein
MTYRLSLVLLLFTAKVSLAQDSSIVYFNFDRYELTAESRQALDTILAKPNLYNTVIYGHTDQLGSNEYNERLSIRRANAVKDYFIRQGVPVNKIKVVQGFGETMPVINKLDEVSRQSNRRVVIITNYEIFAKDSVIVEQKPKEEKPKVEPPKPQPKVPATNQPVRKPIKENLITEIIDSSTREGDNIILKNINFYGGRHVFLPEAYTPLTELLYVMQTIPSLEIEIQGHICCMEGQSDGLDIDTGEPFLSYNRARAVYDYLLEKGIDRNRMRYKGYGHKFPLIEFEKSEDERTTNRRVEIKILKK